MARQIALEIRGPGEHTSVRQHLSRSEQKSERNKREFCKHLRRRKIQHKGLRHKHRCSVQGLSRLMGLGHGTLTWDFPLDAVNAIG